MRLEIHLSLPADARLLPRTRRAVAEYLEAMGVDGDERHDVVLALDEACANVVRHAYGDTNDRADGRFDLHADLSPDEIVMRIEDHGCGFDPSTVPVAPPEALSGRGLQIIQEVMTSVDVRSPTGRPGTVLEMRKRIGDRS